MILNEVSIKNMKKDRQTTHRKIKRILHCSLMQYQQQLNRRHQKFVALRNATMAIGRSRRPRGPTYARGANRSQFEDPELAVNARHLATRRAHPAFKFFTSLIPEAESFNLESFVPATTGGLEEHMLPPQMSG
jgi:hypothetical protein